MKTRDNNLNLFSLSQGTVLIEVLLSVVILSVSLTLIIQAMTSSLKASVYAADYTKALFVLEDQWDKLFMKESMGSQETIGGEVEIFNNNYRVQAVTSSVPGELSPNINQVDLQLSWGRPGKEKNIQVSTFLFDEKKEEPVVEIGL